MRKPFYLISVLFLLSFHQVSAQIFTTIIDENALRFRVKQIDEFFERFNYETDYNGDKPKDPKNVEEHKKSFLTIVNLDRFINDKQEIDTTLTRFVDYVINDSVQIHYQDTTWNAEVNCFVKFEGKKYDTSFILKTEEIEKYIFKWVIADVQSELFDSYPNEPKASIIISPAEHGIGFITLPETLNLNNESVGSTFKKGYKRSNLAVFDFLMSNGKVIVDTITKVAFHFHLEEADFDVEHIEKENSYNQGWLINNITNKNITYYENQTITDDADAPNNSTSTDINGN